MDVRVLISLLCVLHSASSEVVEFESGKTFKVVDPASIQDDASEYEDPKNTGSKLFDFEADNNNNKRFSLNVMTYDINKKSSRYFRAHPVFISCLQRILTHLQNQGTQLMISSAYMTRSETGSSTSAQDLYARAGTAAQLSFRPGVPGDLLNIAKAALKFCPPLFERIQRDIGVIMLPSRVHVHMTGADDTQPHFSSAGFSQMKTPEFQVWAQEAINDGLDPVQIPDCSKFSGLESGSTSPDGAVSPEDVVGGVDLPVTRDTLNDYLRLVQYQGTNVLFSVGSPECAAQPVSNSLYHRCTKRLMSARMYNFLKSLQRMVRTNIPGNKLHVLKAFDAPGSFGYSETSLHVEGRQMILQLDKDNTEANLKTVTKYAQCLGVDYIKHTGEHVVLAVRKMKGSTAHKVRFPQGVELLSVDPPSSKMADYALGFIEKDETKFPLFDSGGRHGTLLAPNAPLQLFVSKSQKFRYFRLDPRIPKCFSLMVHHLNKRNEDPETSLDVYRGFMAATERDFTMNKADKRHSSVTLGYGMEIRYKENPRNLTISQLVLTAIDKCAPVFYEKQEYIGVGLYRDTVFVDVREQFEVWTDDVTLTPTTFSSFDEYTDKLEERNSAAIGSRIVDPDDWTIARNSAHVPHQQSPEYRHQPPPHVLRRRRSAPDPNDCVPTGDRAFCAISKAARDSHIESIMAEINRKHHYHTETEVQTALEKCLGTCGTCMEGVYWEEKLEHCDNLLHWIPFQLMNEDTVSNIFPRDSALLRKHACQGHCIEKSELFSLIITAVEAVFRPDPSKSVEEELYRKTENPSPLLGLLYRLYAIHAQGVVKVWVNDDADVIALREPLQVLMLYNKQITGVEVFVSSPGNKDAVAAALEKLKDDWATNGSPLYTREFIAPYSINDLPPLVKKRDVDTSIRERLIEEHQAREVMWARQEL